MSQKLLKKITREIQQRASEENRNNFERYFRGAVQFYGMKAYDVQQIFQVIWPDLKQLSLPQAQKLAFTLFASPYAEDKTLAILSLNKIVAQLPAKFIDKLAKVIDLHVYDWATCDNLCGKVIRRLIEHDATIAEKVMAWKDADNCWRQRAAAVSFVRLAHHGRFNREIIAICTTIIGNDYRFVQLGAGWVLRELSLADSKLVIDFIERHYQAFSREGLRYAIEKMDSKQRWRLLQGKFSVQGTGDTD